MSRQSPAAMALTHAQFQKTVGRRLATYRKNRDMTQERLAEKYGVSRVVLNHYERGVRQASPYFLARFAVGEGLSLDAIYLGIPRTRADRWLEIEL